MVVRLLRLMYVSLMGKYIFITPVRQFYRKLHKASINFKYSVSNEGENFMPTNDEQNNTILLLYITAVQLLKKKVKILFMSNV